MARQAIVSRGAIRVIYRYYKQAGWRCTASYANKEIKRSVGKAVFKRPSLANVHDRTQACNVFRKHVGLILRKLGEKHLDGGGCYECLGNDRLEARISVQPVLKKHMTIGG